MLVLGIDTTAVAASCAVCEMEADSCKVLMSGTINAKQTHSQTMLPMMESLLKGSAIKLENIDRFAVSAGPGSFTGLRIGISAVKGMAFALNKPCAAVSTLEALAYNLLGQKGIACAVMDARCNQVYNALFRVDGETVTRLTPDRALFLTDLADELNKYSEPIILVGDGAELTYRNINGENITLAPPMLRFQHGESVCLASRNCSDISAKELMPGYLRLPQAERERLEREKKEGQK